MEFAIALRKTCLIALALTLAVFLLFSPAAADEDSEDLKYTTNIEGVEDEELTQLIMAVSDTYKYMDRKTASMSMLRRRLKNDLPNIKKALHSRGYFKSEINYEIDTEAKPIAVTFKVDLGPRFLFKEISLKLDEKADERPDLPTPENIGLEKDGPFRSGKVLDAQKEIISYLGDRGYPLAKVTGRRVLADHADDAISVYFKIDPGPKAWFGPVEITGLTTVEETVITRSITWQEGDLFKKKLLNRARTKIMQTGLFSMLAVSPGEIKEDGRLPILIDLRERKHRTIRAGLGYQTDSGPEVRFKWEHRNYFGEGENLFVSLLANEIKQELKGGLTIPYFYHPKQTLTIDASLTNEDSNAYKKVEGKTSAIVERMLSKTTKVGLGAGYKLSQLEEEDEKYGFLYFPALFNYDSRDDLLDPKKGIGFNIWAAPHMDTLGSDVTFVKFQSTITSYYELIKPGKTILAFRFLFGTIQGASLGDVPSNERMYAGGGGSIRGYAYQSAGDLVDKDPVGGLSKLELSGEIRYRFSESLGVTAFLDGGRSFDTEFLDLEQDLFWGAGLGFRYYTPIGPIRLDVAVPLDRREGIDDSYQIYVSIGQSF